MTDYGIKTGQQWMRKSDRSYIVIEDGPYGAANTVYVYNLTTKRHYEVSSTGLKAKYELDLDA